MTIQRLELHQTATFRASPQEIMFTFPPVPTGNVWTGSIGFSLAVGTGPDLQGIVWTCYRNGLPVLSWQEFGVASDIQAVGGEVISVVGVYIGSAATVPQFAIQCSWTGYNNDDPSSEGPAQPWVSGSSPSLVQVFNSNGADAPLSVISAPQGTEHSTAVASAGGSALLLGTPVSGHPYRLWELALQVTAASISTETGAKWLTATLKEDTTSKVLLQTQVSTVPGSADSNTQYIPMRGYTMTDGAALQLTLSSFTGANANATASVVYETT